MCRLFPPDYLRHISYEKQEQDWRDLLSSTMDDLLHCAKTDAGEILGYPLGRSGINEVPPYDSALVALHVRRTYQGQGIGRRLVSVMAKQLMQRGCTSLMLLVLKEDVSRGFYEHLGASFSVRER